MAELFPFATFPVGALRWRLRRPKAKRQAGRWARCLPGRWRWPAKKGLTLNRR